MWELFGLFLQAIGVIVILGSQLVFWYKVRKKYKKVKMAFLDFSIPRYGMSEENFKKISEDEIKEGYRKIPLAGWLYWNYRISVIGSLFILIGLILLFIN